MTSPSVIAVVIGRGGSKGLPGKNRLPLNGRPVVAYTIDAALAARCVDRVVLTTDDADIARVGQDAGIPVVNRPGTLATDTATVDAAVRHAIETLEATEPIVVILYANVPVRPADLIDHAVTTLLETHADSVQSYTDVGKYHPYWMNRLDEEGRVVPYQVNAVYRRQDLPPLFIPDGGVIAVTRDSLFTVDPAQPHAFLGVDRRGVRTEPGSVVDIDTAADFAVAEIRLRDRVTS